MTSLFSAFTAIHICAAGGPSCNDTKLHPGTRNSGAISVSRIDRRLSTATACG